MGDATSYVRRKGGSEGLKAILDGEGYNDKRIIVLGDFNDYFVGTQYPGCEETVSGKIYKLAGSPYENFLFDVANYKGLTKDLRQTFAGGLTPLIDNIIVSNELFDNVIYDDSYQGYDKGIFRETEVIASIAGFDTTTTDHTPISALFYFGSTESPTRDTVKTPVISPLGGNYNDSVAVSVTCATEGATILVSTGSGYSVYTGQMVFHENTTVSVKAFKGGMDTSAVASETYNIAHTSVSGETIDNAAGDVKIYPNPAKNELTISGDNLRGNFEIYNLLGTKVMNGSLRAKGKTVNISSLPAGIYIVKVGDYKVKFIKE